MEMLIMNEKQLEKSELLSEYAKTLITLTWLKQKAKITLHDDYLMSLFDNAYSHTVEKKNELFESIESLKGGNDL